MSTQTGKFTVVVSLAIALGLGIVGTSNAQELVTNGGFETGDFTGWTASKSGAGSELTPWTVGGPGGGWFGSTSPHSGSFDAYNGFDGGGPISYDLYQTLALPSSSTITFSSWNRIVSAIFLGSDPRTFNIDLQDTSGNLLQNLYTHSVLPSSDNFVAFDEGWVNNIFDISAYAGQTVRIDFNETIPQNYTGPANIEFDDISVVANSSVPEPGVTALLCGVTAFGGLFGIRRFRARK